jgi:Ca-activated chloride channel family protein
MTKSLAALTLVLMCCQTPPPPPPPPAAIAAQPVEPEAEPLPIVDRKVRGIVVTASFGGWLRPLDHVDVIGTLADPQTNETVGLTLLQNVTVLAIEKGDSRVSLLVIPEEAEILAVAQRLGELTLTLRNGDDLDVMEERGRATVNTLLSGNRTRVLHQKRFHSIQIIRGSSGGGGSGEDLPPTAGVSSSKVADMYVKHYGVNPTVATTDEATSTFSADVDTGSYTLARAWLGRGELPNEAAVRVEEFVNAFDYGYRAPETEAFAVQVEVFPSPSRAGYHLLRLGLQGKQVDASQRKPANLVFTLDVSGSMAGENRLGLAKRALGLLAGQLTEADTVALVVYGTDARVVLAPTNGAEREKILGAIDGVQSEGSTNVQAGLELAYALATRAFKPNGINRIVLCSDGVANNGVTTADLLFEKVKDRAAKGITLSTVGFGMGTYNDTLMERLADQGDGNYAYVDRLAEAQRIFVEQLTGTLQVIAKDVKLQLEFNSAAVERYRLIGFENRVLAKKDFANDKVDAGDIGAGHSMTALYEVKLKDRSAATLATFRARFKQPTGGASGLIEKALPMSIVQDALSSASGPARLAVIAAGFAEKLRGSYWARNLKWEGLESMLAELPPPVRTQPQVLELARLIATAHRLDHRPVRVAQDLTSAQP